MTTAIKVENLSKAYQLGTIGTGTISRDVHRWWTTKILGKDDPFLKIGETNDRSTKGISDIVWSLKDINFDIEQGDAVGIIGKNGAGKSTLLKILSRVTAPTTGSVKVKGRVASLLEVGTGFHPELTGRENIYLNGAILGMRKKEITRKMDEIVDFSGVERYIDTPVKRYSSGMYVRLAFAVAAHLESEILVVDEVLAVGDAEFQKKCLGKMGDISKGEGRTVLFVSHNMVAIQSFCQHSIFLNNGEIGEIGPTKKIVENYLKKHFNETTQFIANEDSLIKQHNQIKTTKVELLTKSDTNFFEVNDDIILTIHNTVIEENSFILDIQLLKSDGTLIYNICTELLPFKAGDYLSTLKISDKNISLNAGQYIIHFAVLDNKLRVLYKLTEVIFFEINDKIEARSINWTGEWGGIIRPNIPWQITRKSK